MMTRLSVGDYDEWKVQFDRDVPGARRDAASYRIFRSVDNPGEVFIQVEFHSTDDAHAARERLLGSGVLDRFADRTGPMVVEVAEVVG